jgi:RND family efflux transporter MFP subunit
MKSPALILSLACTPLWAADLDALLDWSQRVDLATPVAGIVDAVYVQPGQTVGKGHLLAQLNQRIYEANVMEAKADIDRLSQELADAERDLERAKELYARTVSSTTEFDLAKLRQARATAMLAGAQARLERVRRQLEESSVRAPFDALVLARQAEPGIVTSQCQPAVLLSVARADELLARAEIPASLAANLKPDSQAQVSVAGQEHAGVVRAIRPGVGANYLVEVVIARGPGLVAGLPARVSLP